MVFHDSYFLLFLVLSLISPISSDDRSALLRLRAAIRGNTLSWDSASASPCSWKGITCDHTRMHVIAVRLPGDGLTGRLPLDTIGTLTELRVLSLRHNALSGPLPSDLASCSLLTDLHLQGNRFSGEIPENFSNLTNLLRVNLGGNNFSGALPPGINRLASLRTLFLENNTFSGSLPDLHDLNLLRRFNASFNGFTGSIPTSLRRFSAQSFMGTSLCGGSLVSCSNSKDKNKISDGAIVGINIGSVFGFLLVLLLLLILWRKHKNRKTPPTPVKPQAYKSWAPKSTAITEEDGRELINPTNFSSSHPSNRRLKMVIKNDGIAFFEADDVKTFTLSELFRSSAELLGKGTVGSTYKAYLESGVQVIVKRLKNVDISEKQFRSKVEDFGLVIHENLLPLKGYFYGREEKFLIYDPMPTGGSLYALLHGNNKKSLSWERRIKIALETARGIEYIHSTGPRTTHGNIKSSNIFLASHDTARVSEFGLTQLVSPAPNMNAYRAPEVTETRKNSQSADVYSLGVTLFELLTSKSPENSLLGEGIKLPDWVRSVVHEKGAIEAFDRELVWQENVEEEMELLLNIAMNCTSQHPERRPSMSEIGRQIREICDGGRD